MSYLQTKHNLADLKSVCEAQHNLKIRSMGLQDKSNVNIYDGKIVVSSLALKSENVDSNYVVVSKNTEGDFEWKRLSFAEWMDKDPSEILLSSFSNDMNVVLNSELNIKIEEYLEVVKDTLINSNLTVIALSVSNITLKGDLHDISGAGVLTNGGDGSEMRLSLLEQSYLNSNESSSNVVCSAKAVNDLYTYASEIEERLPALGQSYLMSDQNLLDVVDPYIAQQNLGLLESFQTSNIILQNVSFIEPSVDHVVSSAFQTDTKEYILKKNTQNKLTYKEDKLIDNFLESSVLYAPTANALNDLYTEMVDRISVFLVKENVLSEITGDENLKNIFKTRLIDTGLHNLSFTGDWIDIYNKPTKVSGFENDLEFISSYNNLSDIPNGHDALRNLGISEVGISGNFADLNLPTAISNIITIDDILGAIEGVPFLRKDLYLEEISGDFTAKHITRSNLGIKDMSLFDQNNVEILDGDITASFCDIKENFTYRLSNVFLQNAAYSSNYFLRARNVFGQGVWDTFPVADTITKKMGITQLTNELLGNNTSNEAITPYGILEVCQNNDYLVQLIPIADTNEYGLVKISDDFTTAQTNTVISTTGISNLFSYFTEGNGTFDKALLDQKVETLTTISNVENIINDRITTEVVLINSYLEGNTSLSGPGLGIANEGVLNMIGDRVKTIESTTTSILKIEEFYEAYEKNGYTFQGSNKRIEIGLNLPMTNEENKFLSTTGEFKDVVFYQIKKVDAGEEQIMLKTDITFAGTLLDFNVNTSTISFANPNSLLFEYEYPTTQTVKQLNLKGGLIGDKNMIYTSEIANSYFKKFPNNTYGFDDILNDIPLFQGFENGLVKFKVDDIDRDHYYLNALGEWVDRSEIMDKSAIKTLSITEIGVDDKADNILDVVAVPGSCNVNISMKDLDESKYNYVITRDAVNSDFYWKNPFQTLIDWSSVEYSANYFFSTSFTSIGGYLNVFTGDEDERNPRDYYLDGSGRFIKNQNFTTYLTLSDCNIDVYQDFDVNSTYGISGHSNKIQITHSNVFGINTHYINRSDILHNVRNEQAQIDLFYFEEYTTTNPYSNPTVTYVDFDDVHIKVPSIDTMVTYVTEKASGLSKTTVYDMDFDSQTIILDKMVIGHSLSNYIRRHIVFDYYINNELYNHTSVTSITNELYGNKEQFIRGGNLIEFYDNLKFEYDYIYNGLNMNGNAIPEEYKQKFITPQSLSNWVYEKIETKFNTIVTQSEEYNFNTLYWDKVVSGASLSNYIRHALTYVDTIAFDTGLITVDPEKLVLRRNLVHYIDNLRYVYSESDYATNNINYVTPSNVKRYLDDMGLSPDALGNILKGFVIETADLFSMDSDLEKTIVSLSTLSNILLNQLTFSNYTYSSFVSDNKRFVSSSNVAVYIEDTITDHTFDDYTLTNFETDNETFVSSSNVSMYVKEFLLTKTYDNYTVSSFETDDNRFVSSANVSKYTKDLIETYKNNTINGITKGDINLNIPVDYDNDFVTFSNFKQIVFESLKFDGDMNSYHTDNISYSTPYHVYNYLYQNTYSYNQYNFDKTQESFRYNGIEGHKLLKISDIISILQNDLRCVYTYQDFKTDEVSMTVPKQVHDYISDNIYAYNSYNYDNDLNLVLIQSDLFMNILNVEALSNILLKQYRYGANRYDLNTIFNDDYRYITPSKTCEYVQHFYDNQKYIFDEMTFGIEDDKFITPVDVKMYIDTNINSILMSSTIEYVDLDPENIIGAEKTVITLESLSNILFNRLEIKDTVNNERYSANEYYTLITELVYDEYDVYTNLFGFYIDSWQMKYQGGYEDIDSYIENILERDNNKLLTFGTHQKALRDSYNYIKFNSPFSPHYETTNEILLENIYDLQQNLSAYEFSETMYNKTFITPADLQLFLNNNICRTDYVPLIVDTSADNEYIYRNTSLNYQFIPQYIPNTNSNNIVITLHTLEHYISDFFKVWCLDHVITAEDSTTDTPTYIFPVNTYSTFNDNTINNVEFSIPTLSIVRTIVANELESYDYRDVLRDHNIQINNFAGEYQITILGGPGLEANGNENRGLTCGIYNARSNIYQRKELDLFDDSAELADNTLKLSMKLFEVGMGTSEVQRANALEVLNNGDVYIRGSIILNDGRWRIKTSDDGQELILQKGELVNDPDGGPIQQYQYTDKHTFI